MLWELPKCETDEKWANAVGKMAATDLLDLRLPQTFYLLKKIFFKVCLYVSYKEREAQLKLHS